MPITIKSNTLKYKDPSTGNYVGIDTLAETATSTQVAAVNAAGAVQVGDVNDAGTAQINAVNAAGAAVIQSIPSDYSTLAEEVDNLSTAIDDLEEQVIPSGGSNGQILRKASGADYDVEWSSVGAPTDAQVEEQVDAWLTAHPEVTTTVVDGSLTEAKFSADLKLSAIKDYVTPQMYGAKGDGTTDDTDAVQSAVTYADTTSGAVYFPAGTYLVTDTIDIGDRCAIEMNPKAVIKAGAVMDVVFNMTVGSYLTQRPEYRNIFIDGNSLAVTGAIIDKLSMSNTLAISGMTVQNCTGVGIKFTDCQGAVCAAIRAVNNGGDGVQILGCNSMKVYQLTSYANTGDGVVFGKTTSCRGTPSVFGLSCEDNGGKAINIGADTGLVTIVTGHLEGNGDVPIYVDEGSKCFIECMRIIWGDSGWANSISYCTLKTTFATLQNFELQAGSNATVVPNIVGNVTPTIDSMQRATVLIYNQINEKVFSNIISGGDMDRNSGIDVYSADKTYKSTDLVDTAAGRTYSLKCVINNVNNFMIELYNNTGVEIGQLYKITCRIYYQGSNTMSLKLRARDTSINSSQIWYSPVYPISNNQWNELTCYVYGTSADSMRFGVTIDTNKPSVGDIFYLSTYFLQPVTCAKHATKQIGTTWMYNEIEPSTIN